MLKRNIKIPPPLYLLVIIVITLSSWRCLTKGFRPSKIIGSIPFIYSTIDRNQDDEHLAQDILKQKFTYLNKGAQAFVFGSADDKYVIKFIALNKYTEPFRRSLLEGFSSFKDYRKERLFDKERNFKSALRSYEIVYNNLKEETGTVYIHFKNNHIFSQNIKVVDNLGITHEIDPNTTLFIIQKKADIVKPLLVKHVKNNSTEEIKKIVSNYLSLADKILKKGIINKDSSVKNTGLYNDIFLEVDIGRFENAPNPKQNYAKYLKKHTRLYRTYLEENIPEMVGYFDDKINDLRDQNE